MYTQRNLRHTLFGLMFLAVLVAISGCSPTPFEITEMRKNESSGYYDAVVKTKSLRDYSGLPVDEFRVTTWGRRMPMKDLVFTETGKNAAKLEYGDTFIIPLVKPEWKIYFDHQKDYVWSKDLREMIPAEDRLDVTHSEAMKVAKSIKPRMDAGTTKPMPDSLPHGWELARETSEGESGSLRFEEWREDRLREAISVDYRAMTDEEKEAEAAGKTIDYLLGYVHVPHRLANYGHTEMNGKTAVFRLDQDISTLESGALSPGGRCTLAYFDDGQLVDIGVWSSPYEWTLPPGQKLPISRMPENIPDDFELLYLWGQEKAMERRINILADGRGTYHKLMGEQTTEEQEFRLSQEEMRQLYACFRDNHFPAFAGEYIRTAWFGSEFLGSSIIKLTAAGAVYEGKYLRYDDRRYIIIRGKIHATVMPYLKLTEEENKAFEEAVKAFEERQRTYREMFRPKE